MRLQEILLESVSKIVYHACSIHSAVKILESGYFELTSDIGTDVEKSYAPRGYHYYLSTARTRMGGYHEKPGIGRVLLELDGDVINQHYPSKAIDYWEDRNPQLFQSRTSEAEDRIFSKNPRIPALPIVKSVSIYLNPEAEDSQKAIVRRIMLIAKKNGIPANYWANAQDWKLNRIDRAEPVNTLRGQAKTGGYISRHRGFLRPFIELLRAHRSDQLSEEAQRILRNISDDYSIRSTIRSLENDLHNTRTAAAGSTDRKFHEFIIEFMRKNKLETLGDLMKFIRDRWNKNNLKESNTSGMDQKAGIGIDGQTFRFNVRDLIAHAEKYPVKNIDPKQFQSQLDQRREDPSTSKSRMEKADLKFPIIVVKRNNGELYIADGTHRTHKAIENNIDKIKARIIPVNDMKPFLVNKKPRI